MILLALTGSHEGHRATTSGYGCRDAILQPVPRSRSIPHSSNFEHPLHQHLGNLLFAHPQNLLAHLFGMFSDPGGRA